MKLLFSIAFFIISGLSFSQADITAPVVTALEKGDAANLSRMMMPQVELTLNNQDRTTSKAEAQKLLVVFFNENPPTRFTIKHQGTSKLDDQYCIGDLNTTKNRFRVTFFMKKSESTMLIRQLKIE